MAITSVPYGSFLTVLPQTGFQVVMGDVSVALLDNTYTPDLVNHQVWDDVSNYEIAWTTGTPGAYENGGLIIGNRLINYDNPSKTATLTADPVVWTNLTGTVRYAVIYAWTGMALLGLIDFGSDRVFAGENLTLTFTNGLMTLAAA